MWLLTYKNVEEGKEGRAMNFSLAPRGETDYPVNYYVVV
jgi:hypothetical protein